MANVSQVDCRFHCCPSECLQQIGKFFNTVAEKIKAIVRRILNCLSPPKPTSQEIKITLHTNYQVELELQKVILAQAKEKPSTAYCKKVLKDVQEFRGEVEEHHAQLKTAQQEIAQVLYLEDKLQKPLDHEHPEIKTQIQQTFEASLNGIQKRLAALSEAQGQGGLQDPRLTLQIATPKEIGKALVIISSGVLNTGIIPDMRKLLSKDNPMDYEIVIHKVLEQLENSTNLHVIFDSIVKPEDPHHPINQVIRCVLGLSPETPISDVHAKQAALIALLSHLRQGPIGDCFAVYLGIGLLNQRLDKCLKDFAEILKTGRAVRLIDGHPKEFHFVMNIADDSRIKKFKLQRSGILFSQQIPIYEIPGIKAALMQMGINKPAEATEKVLQTLFKDSDPKNLWIECTAESLIPLYANSQEQVQIGLFAFCCETNNGLLRVWENLLAAMAEANPTGYTNAKVIASVIDGLSDFFKTTALAKGPQPVNVIRDSLKGALNGRIRLIYDFTIGDGGYRLENVTNPNEFKTFIIQALGDIPQKDKTLDKIADYIKNDPNFLKKALWSFDDENKKFEDPVANLARLKGVPWRYETGNNLRRAYAAELEQPMPTPILSHPKNAQDLAIKFLQLCTKLSKETSIYTNDKPNEIIPVEVPTHAFNATIETPEILAFLKSGQSPEDWFKAFQLDVGFNVSRMQMGKQEREDAIKYIVDNKMVPETSIASFREMTNKLLNGPLMIQSFASRIMKYLLDLNKGAEEKRLHEIWQTFAGYLLNQGLPPQAREQLNSASLLIGNLNWNENVEDLQFKVMFDVIHLCPILVGVSTHHTQFRVVNEEEWVTVRWRYFPTDYQ